ncbi:hypothetical protein GCM10010361_19510 [Streptomyces olivaceiscleroticus]|uniref:Uncharacterized protein n=1 Tax=Streptomyces olivaceiscleroticus TaxID=68245 RepID=A0ABP3JM13_9ACTN
MASRTYMGMEWSHLLDEPPEDFPAPEAPGEKFHKCTSGGILMFTCPVVRDKGRAKAGLPFTRPKAPFDGPRAGGGGAAGGGVPGAQPRR